MKIHVHARDDSERGWLATVTGEDGVSITCHDDFVLMTQLITRIVRDCKRKWWEEEEEFIVESCKVDDDDDGGMLMGLLQQAFTTSNKDG